MTRPKETIDEREWLYKNWGTDYMKEWSDHEQDSFLSYRVSVSSFVEISKLKKELRKEIKKLKSEILFLEGVLLLHSVMYGLIVLLATK